MVRRDSIEAHVGFCPARISRCSRNRSINLPDITEGLTGDESKADAAAFTQLVDTEMVRLIAADASFRMFISGVFGIL